MIPCRPLFAVLLAVVLAAAAACGGDDDGAVGDAGTDVASIEVSSDDLTDGGTIPEPFTCDGADVPPSLSWSGVPDEAESLVVAVEDPDAPAGVFTHWIVWSVPPDAGSVGEELPADAVAGTNDFGDPGYRGPCPPEGDEPHTYRFRVLALDTTIELPRGAGAGEVAEAVEGHVIAEGELTATYGR